jgi:NAD(P)-dependent dehydrogenase (short-subunit alcohol dehydrogenase family)
MIEDYSLEGAVALVTGAGGGIGAATCAALRSSGATVVGVDLRDRPEDTVAALWHRLDVTSEDDWARVVGDIGDRYGRLDCLVNNAGIAITETFENTTAAQWRTTLAVNVEGIASGVKAALPLLTRSGATRAGGSSIVNLSSTAGLGGSPYNVAYSASKGAVTLMTRAMAREFGELGYPIRVNSVHPSVIRTEMLEGIMERYVELGRMPSVQAAVDGFSSRIPLGRFGTPEEIANGIAFLCSPAASFMDGTQFLIDGGALA